MTQCENCKQSKEPLEKAHEFDVDTGRWGPRWQCKTGYGCQRNMR